MPVEARVLHSERTEVLELEPRAVVSTVHACWELNLGLLHSVTLCSVTWWCVLLTAEPFLKPPPPRVDFRLYLFLYVCVCVHVCLQATNVCTEVSGRCARVGSLFLPRGSWDGTQVLRFDNRYPRRHLAGSVVFVLVKDTDLDSVFHKWTSGLLKRLCILSLYVFLAFVKN